MSRYNLLNSLRAVQLFLDRNLVTRYDISDITDIKAFNIIDKPGDTAILELNIQPLLFEFNRYSFAEYLYDSINKLYNYIESRPRIHHIVLDIQIPSIIYANIIDLKNMIELFRGIIHMVYYDQIRLHFNDMNKTATILMNYILDILSNLTYTIPLLYVSITGEYQNDIPTKHKLTDKSIDVDTLQLETNGIDIPMSLSEWIVSKINFRRLVGDTVKDVYYDQDRYEKL